MMSARGTSRSLDFLAAFDLQQCGRVFHGRNVLWKSSPLATATMNGVRARHQKYPFARPCAHRYDKPQPLPLKKP